MKVQGKNNTKSDTWTLNRWVVQQNHIDALVPHLQSQNLKWGVYCSGLGLETEKTPNISSLEDTKLMHTES